jgi:hypothetical protein
MNDIMVTLQIATIAAQSWESSPFERSLLLGNDVINF